LASGRFHLFEGHEGPTPYIAFHPRGDFMASCSWDGTTRLWDVYSGHALVSTEEGGNLNFSRDGKRLALFRDNEELGLWQVAESAVFRALSGRPGLKTEVNWAVFGRDGRSLVWADTEDMWWLELGSGELGHEPMPDLTRIFFDQTGLALYTVNPGGLR